MDIAGWFTKELKALALSILSYLRFPRKTVIPKQSLVFYKSFILKRAQTLVSSVTGNGIDR